MAKEGKKETTGVWLIAPGLPELVHRVSRRYQLRGADQEEVLQETMIALWEVGLDAKVNAAWVARVAANKAVDLIRKNLRSQRRERAYASLCPPTTADPEAALLLHASIAGLPAPLRQFYELHYVEAWSEREIAKHLGKCRASVRWLDRNCRRAIIGPAGHDQAKEPGRGG